MSDITTEAINAFRIQTKNATITIQPRTGVPQDVTAIVTFDHPVLIAWTSVLGMDVSLSGNEKEINRVLFNVTQDAPAGKTVTVNGHVGIKDNSGTFDDTYQGTLHVLVTAVTQP